MATTDLATRNGQEIAAPAGALRGAAAQLMLAPRTLQEAEWLAEGFARSGMFAAKSTDEALTILLTGLELGLGPAQAMRSISVAQGRPTLNAEAMLALVRKRTDICKYFHLIESTDQVATYETQRSGSPAPVRMSFTLGMAQAAGLAEKNVWKQYRATMLRWRCVSMLVKAEYSEICLGLYTPDELGEAEQDLKSGDYDRREAQAADVIDGATGEVEMSDEERKAVLIGQLRADMGRLPKENQREVVRYMLKTFQVKDPNKLTIEQLKGVGLLISAEAENIDAEVVGADDEVPPSHRRGSTRAEPSAASGAEAPSVGQVYCHDCAIKGNQTPLSETRIELCAKAGEPPICHTCQASRQRLAGQQSLIGDGEETDPFGEDTTPTRGAADDRTPAKGGRK